MLVYSESGSPFQGNRARGWLRCKRILLRGRHQFLMRQNFSFLLLSLLVPARVLAADFSYAGTFSQDDEVRSFNFTLSQPSKVVIRTFSYAGGVNSTGTTLPRGGFDPTLSLFDANGALIAVNRDAGCDKVAPDAVTHQCWDAYIELQLPAGGWRAVLTQSENTANGPSLSDAFAYDGTGNFTMSPEGAKNPGFWDFFPDRRTTSLALEIRGADSSEIPISSNLAVLNGASFLAGAAGPNTILSLFDAQLKSDPSITVSIDGVRAEVIYAGASQINFVVPPGILPKTGARLDVRRGSDLLRTTSIDIADASPALFTATTTGAGQAAVLNVLAAGGVAYNGSVAPSIPARRGTYLAVFGTGFGSANAPGADGLSWLVQPVNATIGGVPAQVVFAGLAPESTMGLQQINILIPDDCPVGPAVPIRLRVGSYSTQPGATVAIEQ
jgi:uncharacterized protein (TIGR03437 family)